MYARQDYIGGVEWLPKLARRKIWWSDRMPIIILLFAAMQQKNKQIYIAHLLFWLVYVGIRLFVVQFYKGSLEQRIVVELIELPLKMLALYGMIYFLIPRFLLKKKFTLFFVFLIAAIVLVGLLRRLEDLFVVFPLLYEEGTYTTDFWNKSRLFSGLVYIYPVVGFGTAVYFAKSWFDNQLLAEQLKREKVSSELRLLKAQVHPHFLFNTINNIYSLSLTKSDNTPKALLQLSSLLNYVLYECNSEKVLLSKEIKLLEDYIALEQMRYHAIDIQFKVVGAIEGYQIAPLLLLPFVENAFKHGASTSIDQPWIVVLIDVVEERLHLVVENSSNPNVQEQKGGYRQGIGINNVVSRLQLQYPNNFVFEKHKNGNTFLVKLELPLSKIT